CNWSCRLGLLTKDAVLAQERAWRDRAQTGPSMRSASVSEDERSIMGQRCGVCAPSLTSSDALLKESCEYRQRPLQHLRFASRFTLVLKASTISLQLIHPRSAKRLLNYGRHRHGGSKQHEFQLFPVSLEAAKALYRYSELD